MIDGLPNRPLYFYQKDIIGGLGVWGSFFDGNNGTMSKNMGLDN